MCLYGPIAFLHYYFKKMKEEKNTTLFETVPKSNRIIIDRGKIDTSHTKLLHDHSFSDRFYIGGKKIVSVSGPIRKFVDRDHCQ
jgi:outer membrane translocation and assembly module TamA